MLSRFKAAFQTDNSASARIDGPASGPYCAIDQLMALRLNARKLRLPKAKRISRPQTGSHRSRFRGRGMEFSEVRAYQPADDVRSIDWRVTARRQKPHTKLFNEERERPVFILCDQSRSQFFGSHLAFKSVRAAETAALFAWTALEHNDRVGGIVFSEQGHKETRPARSRKQILRLLSDVNEFNQHLSIEMNVPSPAFSFNDALTETVRLVKPGTLIVIISDFRQVNSDTDKLLSKLAQHNELLMARTFDPIEEALPPPGFYPVSNGEETLIINTQSVQSRQAYANWAKSQHDALQAMCARYKAPIVEVSTHEAPLHSLQSMLISLGA